MLHNSVAVLQCYKLLAHPQVSELQASDETEKLLKTMLALVQTQRLLREHHLDVNPDLTGAKLIIQLYTDVPTSCATGHGRSKHWTPLIQPLF